MYSMSAERAVMDILGWTQDMKEAKALAHDVASEFAGRFRSLEEPENGVTHWLRALASARVPCAIVSNLDRYRSSLCEPSVVCSRCTWLERGCLTVPGCWPGQEWMNQASACLEAKSLPPGKGLILPFTPCLRAPTYHRHMRRMRRRSMHCRHTLIDTMTRLRIRNYFQTMVTAEDGMETRSQQLLSAAIKLGRPPNQCVAFVSDMQGITAAHNSSLRAVAVAGRHPGYRLGTADLTCGTLGDLTVYNLRRLFANSGHELMDLRKMNSDEPPLKKVSLEIGFL
jgi:hypothetical protein